MNTGQIITVALIIWITIPLLAAYLSKRKKRDTNFWVFSSIVFPPLVLLLLFLPKQDKEPTRRFGEDRESDDSFFPNRD